MLLLLSALLHPATAGSPATSVDVAVSAQVLGDVAEEAVLTLVIAKKAEILACNRSAPGFIGYAVIPARGEPPFIEWKASSFVEPDVPRCVRDVLKRVVWPMPARYGVVVTFALAAPAPAQP